MKSKIFNVLKYIYLYGMMFGVIGSIGAQNSQPTKEQFTEMLRKADSMVTFQDSDFSAEYSFEQTIPGQGTNTKKSMVFRRDKDNTYLIVMTMPKSDKGKGYLKEDNKLWLYDPVSRRYILTSAKDRFQNLNARNSDFTRSNLAGDYTVASGVRQKLGRFDCWVLDLDAKTDDLTFPHMRIWVSADSLVRKTEDYSLSGKSPVRITAFPDYQKVGSRFVPTEVVIVDMLNGAMINGKFESERTTYYITQPSLQPLPTSTFSKIYLEKLNE